MKYYVTLTLCVYHLSKHIFLSDVKRDNIMLHYMTEETLASSKPIMNIPIIIFYTLLFI